MEDNEVGVLWDDGHCDDVIAKLIKKLVEERAISIASSACSYDGNCFCANGWKAHIPDALFDFGIAPETFS
jgi:hypothetical protein